MITLVLGGARSGKSAAAERLAGRLTQPVTYVATASVTDDDMAARVARHRARRPPEWSTVESGPELADLLAGLRGTVLVDSLGAWLAGREGFVVDAGRLCQSLRERAADTIVVSEEVGLGVHPSTESGNRFRDALGELNQTVAEVAERVVLVVAGRLLPLGPV